LGFLFEAGGEHPMTYKIKRLAKILTVCAGIVVVSVSLGIISALEIASYAISHHKDPAMGDTFSVVLTLVLLVGGIGGFMTAVWRVEGEARRRLSQS
jgi:hypothetical protein